MADTVADQAVAVRSFPGRLRHGHGGILGLGSSPAPSQPRPLRCRCSPWAPAWAFLDIGLAGPGDKRDHVQGGQRRVAHRGAVALVRLGRVPGWAAQDQSVGAHRRGGVFRDTAHGFLSWALSVVIGVALLAAATSWAAGEAARGAGAVTAGAASGLAQGATDQGCARRSGWAISWTPSSAPRTRQTPTRRTPAPRSSGFWPPISKTTVTSPRTTRPIWRNS